MPPPKVDQSPTLHKQDPKQELSHEMDQAQGAGQGRNDTSTVNYIREPSGALVAQRTSTGANYYYTFDNLGSVTGLLNSSGTYTNTYTYDPYGQTRSQTEGTTNPFKYTGGHQDASSNLYKLGIRYYDPTLGRFTQQDPTGQDAHYTYSSNSPSNRIDPSGAGGIDIGSALGSASDDLIDSGIDTFNSVVETGEDFVVDEAQRCVVVGAGGAIVGGVTTGPGGIVVGAQGGCVGGIIQPALDEFMP